jgi:predicted transcriptional regulator
VKSAKRESAESVRKMLDEAGLNQCEAARLIGVSPRTMRRYVSLSDESAVEMPPPTRSLLTMLTDQLRAARSVRRQQQRRRA